MRTRLLPAARPGAPFRSSRLLLGLALVLVGAPWSTLAPAATYTWIAPGGGAWSTAANWSPAGVPAAGTDVAVLPGQEDPYAVTLDADPAIASLELATGATLDLATHSLAAVANVDNGGTLLGYRGLLDGTRVHNLAGGTIRVAAGDSIVLADSLANDGTIVIGPTAASALYVTGSAALSGSGRLVLEWGARINCALPRTQYAIWLTNGPGHTIVGAGDVWLPVRNEGLVLQDNGSGSLLTLHCALYNWGTVKAADGGTINVDCPLVKSFGGRIVGSDGTFTVMMPFGVGGSIDNLAGGSFVAEGGDLRLGCGTIAGGSVVRAGGSGVVDVVSLATPQNLVVEEGAELVVDGLMDLTVDGSSLANHGTVRLRGTMNIGGGPSNGVSFTGDGTLVLEGGTLGTPAGATLTNQAGHTITGCGTISANLVNLGVVEVDCPEIKVMNLRSTTFTNRNRFDVRRGTVSFLGSTFTNRGTVSGAGGTIRLQGGVTVDNTAGAFIAGPGNVYVGSRTAAATLAGGTLAAEKDGIYRNQGLATLRGVTIGAGATFVTPTGATTRASGTRFVDRGTNRIEAGGTFAADATTPYVEESGTTRLDGGTLVVPRGLDVHGVLAGRGRIVGDVANAGEVAPAPAAAGLAVSGDYDQAASGRLRIALVGPGEDQFARLLVEGRATLDGSVAIESPGGFVPDPGAEFPVVAFASRSGQFADVESEGAIALGPRYDATRLVLEALATVGVPAPEPLPVRLEFAARGTAFRLALPEAAEVTVQAYDVRGRAVAILADGPRAAGVHELELHAAAPSLPSGVYFARATVRTAAGTTVRGARVAYLR